MMNYELMYVIPGKFTSEERKTASTKIDTIIKDNGGNITTHEEWVTRKLSYPMAHTRQGTFMLARLSLPLEALAKINRELVLDETILRHQIVKVAKGKQTTVSKPTAPRMLPQEAVDALDARRGTKDDESSFAKASADKEEVSPEQLEQKLEELLSDEKPIVK